MMYAYFRQKITNTLDVLNTLIPVLQAVLVLPVLGLGVFGALLALLIGTAVSVTLNDYTTINHARAEGSVASVDTTASSFCSNSRECRCFRRVRRGSRCAEPR